MKYGLSLFELDRKFLNRRNNIDSVQSLDSTKDRLLSTANSDEITENNKVNQPNNVTNSSFSRRETRRLEKEK